MKTRDLIAALQNEKLLLDTEGVMPDELLGVSHDSRQVHAGMLFCAVNGTNSDGRSFIPAACENGAAAVLYAGEKRVEPGVFLIRVRDDYYGYACACACHFDFPSKKLRLCAVTGTNGKTTTAYLAAHLLSACGHHCGLITTVCTYDGKYKAPSEHTTPDAFILQQLFRRMVDHGCDCVVMEYSSHGLVQHRTGTARFDGAVFSNLTGDHLDYHKDMEHYYQAKKILFAELLKPNAKGFINCDDPYGVRLAEELPERALMGYGQSENAQWRMNRLHSTVNGSRLSLQTPEHEGYAVITPHIGTHNAYNIVAALCAAYAIHGQLEPLIEASHKYALPSVPGRLQQMTTRRGVRVFIDYAHTDDALKNVLTALKEFVTERDQRLICVFGCGGDRDRTKRPRMTRVACDLCDVVWLTSDNPRSEEPEKIIEEMIAGIPEDSPCTVLKKVNRKHAIDAALCDAMRGDLVLIAGKGHEDYQEIKGEKKPFDDAKVVEEVIFCRGL